jgi:hypothetical protein
MPVPDNERTYTTVETRFEFGIPQFTYFFIYPYRIFCTTRRIFVLPFFVWQER